MKYQMRPAMFAIDPRIDRQQRVELMAGKQSRLFIFFNQLHLLQIICYLKWDEPKFPVINGSILYRSVHILISWRVYPIMGY